ncbi:MAG TPA: lysylphosphatidylglycerol synthase domain-containing protein [Vicinamibacterales bacterium]|nr:lysylphosphatidylglycerol synthase domain-containing protein [Vicinamibacterales bacterium]
MPLQNSPGPDAAAAAGRRGAGIGAIAAWVLTIAFVGYVAWFLVDRQEVFSQRFAGTWTHVVLLASAVAASWVVTSLQTLLPLRELGVSVGFWENLMLTVAAGFGNVLPMRAGTALRLHYIKSVHGVGYLRYGGILGVRSLMLALVAGVLGLSCAASMAASSRPVPAAVFVVFAGLLAAGAAPLIVPVQRLMPSGGIAGRIGSEIAAAVRLMRANRRMTAWYIALVAAHFALLTARLAVAFDVLQARPAAWTYCFLSPIATILSFVNITPGNLGLREWVLGLLTAGLGIDYAVGIFAAAVDRTISLLMVLPAGGAATVGIVFRLTRAQAR